MKEVEVIIGIILIVIGGIVFEMGQNYAEEAVNWGNIIKLFGLVLVSVGVIIYVLVIDSIDETKKKEIRTKSTAK
jgi:drug/metabolite transporter (DMT)-like permease